MIGIAVTVKRDVLRDGLSVIPGKGVNDGDVVAVADDCVGGEGVAVHRDGGIHRPAHIVHQFCLGIAVEGGQKIADGAVRELCTYRHGQNGRSRRQNDHPPQRAALGAGILRGAGLFQCLLDAP